MSSDKCDLEFTSSKSLYTWLAVRKLGIFLGAVMGMLTVIGDKLAGPMDLTSLRRLPSTRSTFWSGKICWSGVTPMLLLSWSNGPGEGPSGNPRPWFCWGENRVCGIWFIDCRRGNWDRVSKNEILEFVTVVDSPLEDTYIRQAHIHGKLELVPAFLLYTLYLTRWKTVITNIDGHTKCRLEGVRFLRESWMYGSSCGAEQLTNISLMLQVVAYFRCCYNQKWKTKVIGRQPWYLKGQLIFETTLFRTSTTKVPLSPSLLSNNRGKQLLCVPSKR